MPLIEAIYKNQLHTKMCRDRSSIRAEKVEWVGRARG